MTKCLICLVSAVGLLFSGCAHLNSSHAADAISDDVRQASARAPSQRDEGVYYVLAAELAAQRGQYDVALDNYLKAATLTDDVKLVQRAAQLALYLKKTDKALTTAQLWLERQPDSVDARKLTAFLLLNAGRIDEAADQLVVLLSTPGVDVENTMIDLVKLLSTDASKDDSMRLMRRLGERFPNLAELHFASALLASDKGEYQTAMDETEIALRLHPNWNRARLLQAQILAKMGNPKRARELMAKAIQAEPNNLRLRLVYSQYLAKSGDLHGSANELDKILAKEPHNEEALLGLALTQLELGQEAKARQLLEHLAESPNHRMQAYFYLGLLEARKKNFRSAVEWFDKVNEGPVEFDAQMNAVTAQIYLGNLAEANQRLADLRAKFPQQALRLYLLEAELLTKDKNYTRAFELLSQALKEMPGQPDLLYSRALVAEELDRVDVLEADLKAVLEKKPDDPNALNALGFTLADRSERLEEAKGYIAKALELKPDEPSILDSYGWVHYRLGDTATALKYLRHAYELVKDPEIGAHYGEVLWESGRQNEAKAIWKELSRKYPDNSHLKKVMTRYPDAFH